MRCRTTASMPSRCGGASPPIPPGSACRPGMLPRRAGWDRVWPPSRCATSLLLTGTLILGMAAACLMLMDVGKAVLRALPALPAAVPVHLVQLAVTAMAWPVPCAAPRGALMLRARWIRESLNGLLPLVGIGGGVLAAFPTARQIGRPVAGVAAEATVDLLI